MPTLADILTDATRAPELGVPSEVTKVPDVPLGQVEERLPEWAKTPPEEEGPGIIEKLSTPGGGKDLMYDILAGATPLGAFTAPVEAFEEMKEQASVLDVPLAQEVGKATLEALPGGEWLQKAAAGTPVPEAPQPALSYADRLGLQAQKDIADKEQQEGMAILGGLEGALGRYRKGLGQATQMAERGLEQESEAVQAQSQIMQQQAQMLAGAAAAKKGELAGYRMAHDEMEELRQRSMSELDTQMETARREFKALEPDPDRIMRPMKNKIMAAVALGFGQIGASLTKQPNEVAKLIEGIIDRDIRKQEMEFRKKRTEIADLKDAYAFTRTKFQDNQQALMFAKALMVDEAATYIEQINAEFGGKLGAAQMEQVAAQLGQKMSEVVGNMYKHQWMADYQKANIDLRRSAIQAKTAMKKAELSAAGQKQIAGQMAGWGMLQEFRRKYNQLELTSPEKRQAWSEGKLAEAGQIMKTLLGQRVTQAEIEWLSEAVPTYLDSWRYNPFSKRSVADEKWDLLIDMLEKRIHSTKEAWLDMAEMDIQDLRKRDFAAEGYKEH